MAQHGGKRAGAGRKPGSVGKAKKALAALARDQAEAALNTLLDIMANGESEAARLSAANAVLDRGYGKAFQGVNPEPEDDEAPTLSINITSESPIGDVRVTRPDG